MIYVKIRLPQSNDLKKFSFSSQNCSLQGLKAIIMKMFQKNLPVNFLLQYSSDLNNDWTPLEESSDMTNFIRLDKRYLQVRSKINLFSFSVNTQSVAKYQTAKPPAEKQQEKVVPKVVNAPPFKQSPKMAHTVKKIGGQSRLDVSSKIIDALIQKVERQMKEEENRHKKIQERSSDAKYRQPYEKIPEQKNKKFSSRNDKTEQIKAQKAMREVNKEKHKQRMTNYGEPLGRNIYKLRQEKEDKEDERLYEIDQFSDVISEKVFKVYESYPHLGDSQFNKICLITKQHPYLTSKQIYDKCIEAKKERIGRN